MGTVEFLFWACLIVGLYPYIGYPLGVYLLGCALQRPIQRSAVNPSVTVAIACYNEAAHIAATVLNKLEQDYPPEQLEVIVASDGSDDGTDDVVTALAQQRERLRLVRQEPRQGKTAALNRIIPLATGEIIVFADANSLYRPNAIRELVANFADPQVGYVSGQMLYVNRDGSLVGDGCSAYMRFENALRVAETRIGSIVGVDGGIDAVRTRLYRPMRADQLPDFVLPLSVVEQGFRVVFEPEAVLNEDTLSAGTTEYRMRVRVALRALWALWDKRALLNPLRYPLFAWQLLSHKLLRYLSFAPLALAAVLNWVLLSSGSIYQIAAVIQVLFALFAAVALIGPTPLAGRAAPRYCYYFLLLNVASAIAFGRFLAGKKQVLWQPRAG